MVKKALIALVVLALILVGFVWYAVSNANALIARFKPEIEAAASDALGAPVRFGELDTSIFPATKVVIDTVAVGSEGGLTLKNIALHLNLRALLAKRLEITELSITEPSITAVKDSTGTAIEGLPRPTGAKPAAAAPKPNTEGAAAPPLDIKLERFVVKNATVVVRDTVAKTEERITGLSIDAGLDLEGAVVKLPALAVSGTVRKNIEFSLDAKAIAFDGGRNTLSAPDNSVTVAGIPLKVSAELETRTGNGTVVVRSSGIDLGKLTKLGAALPPALTALGLKGSVAPDISTVLRNGKYDLSGSVALRDVALTQGAYTVSGLNTTIALKVNPGEQVFSTEDLSLTVNGESMSGKLKGAVRGRSNQLHDLSLALLGGRLSMRGSHDSSNQAFSTQVDLTNIDIARLLAMAKPGTPSPLSGRLEQSTLLIAATAGPDLMKTLKGNGSFALKDGKLAGKNIGGSVLKTAINLPFVSGALYDSVPPETRKALDANETVISSLSASYALGNGVVTTKDLSLKSALFDVAAAGQASFAGALDLTATILFEKGLSNAIANKAKEVRAALDKDGRLGVPLTIKGTAPNLSVMPDFAKLLSGNVGKVIEQKAGDTLNKLLGGKKGSGKGLGGLKF